MIRLAFQKPLSMLVSSEAASTTPRRAPISAVNTENKDPIELELNAHLMQEAAQYVHTGHLMYKPGMRPYGARPRSSSPRAAPGTPRVPSYLKGRISDSPRLQQLVEEIKRDSSPDPSQLVRLDEIASPQTTGGLAATPTRKLEVEAPSDPTATTPEGPSIPPLSALQAVLLSYEATLEDGSTPRDRYCGLAVIAAAVKSPREVVREPLYGQVDAHEGEHASPAQRAAGRLEAQDDELRARRTRMEELLREQQTITAKPKSEYELFLDNLHRSKLSYDAQREADARKMELTERMIQEEEAALATERARPATPRAQVPVPSSERKAEMEARLREMAEEKEQLLDEEEEWRDSYDAVLRVRAKFEHEKQQGGGAEEEPTQPLIGN